MMLLQAIKAPRLLVGLVAQNRCSHILLDVHNYHGQIVIVATKQLNCPVLHLEDFEWEQSLLPGDGEDSAFAKPLKVSALLKVLLGAPEASAETTLLSV